MLQHGAPAVAEHPGLLLLRNPHPDIPLSVNNDLQRNLIFSRRHRLRLCSAHPGQVHASFLSSYSPFRHPAAVNPHIHRSYAADCSAGSSLAKLKAFHCNPSFSNPDHIIFLSLRKFHGSFYAIAVTKAGWLGVTSAEALTPAWTICYQC